MEREERIIGWIEVDSGMVSIGDPAYMNKPEWKALVGELLDPANEIEGAPRTSYARKTIVHHIDDFEYPVYAQFEGERVVGLRVDFEHEGDDEDDENDE